MNDLQIYRISTSGPCLSTNKHSFDGHVSDNKRSQEHRGMEPIKRNDDGERLLVASVELADVKKKKKKLQGNLPLVVVIVVVFALGTTSFSVVDCGRRLRLLVVLYLRSYPTYSLLYEGVWSS